jgi:hypothetical protein
MNTKAMRETWLCSALAAQIIILLLATTTQANAAPCSGPYVKGDVFASVGSGTVDVFTPTGSPVCSLNDGTGSTFTTGSGFDSAGNFYVTNFSTGTVSKFNATGGLVSGSFMTPPPGTAAESINNVSVGPFSGSSFVGGSGAFINQYNTSTGALIKSFTVVGGNGTGRTDWVDLALDGHTMLYDGEGSIIKSFDLATNTQNADFSTAPAVDVFALRMIPDGVDKGDVLAADSGHALLLDSSGNIIKTYTLPGNGGGDFSLNLDPNGTDFWTGDDLTGTLWEVNILTGAIDEQWKTGTGSETLFGVSVFGEITSGGGGGGGSTVPEPSTWAMMLIGFIGLGFVGYRHRTLVSAV